MAEKKHILFVDDDPAFLHGLRRLLFAQRKVWEMNFVLSADEALEETLQQHYDLIISDVSMPGKDGFELLGMLREREQTQDIPVIILTGGDELSYKRRALDMGATDLLNKPVSQEDLVARIWSALRLKSYQDELKQQKSLLENKVQERTAELEDSRLEIIWRLAKAGEYRDKETGNHIIRVGYISYLLAEQLGMDEEFKKLMFVTSPLHDIGKIAISDTILLKPGKLTPQERLDMQTHTTIGADLLRPDARQKNALRAICSLGLYQAVSNNENPLLRMAAIIALRHHEWWDGSGYPDGLKGDAIPLEARIVALADVYDALRSQRPYKPPMSEEKAMAIMHEESLRHFDPMVYDAFLKRQEDLQVITDQYADGTLDETLSLLQENSTKI
ncbi:MAG: response regulator [Sedimentisphaerales bacterium]|nr:response regulator [Sedimentisphaerales bacterium]